MVKEDHPPGELLVGLGVQNLEPRLSGQWAIGHSSSGPNRSSLG